MSHYTVFSAGLFAGVMFTLAYAAYQSEDKDRAILCAALGLFSAGIYLAACVFQ